jgi:hypothetical protein
MIAGYKTHCQCTIITFSKFVAPSFSFPVTRHTSSDMSDLSIKEDVTVIGSLRETALIVEAGFTGSYILAHV